MANKFLIASYVDANGVRKYTFRRVDFSDESEVSVVSYDTKIPNHGDTFIFNDDPEKKYRVEHIFKDADHSFIEHMLEHAERIGGDDAWGHMLEKCLQPLLANLAQSVGENAAKQP